MSAKIELRNTCFLRSKIPLMMCKIPCDFCRFSRGNFPVDGVIFDHRVEGSEHAEKEKL